MARIGFTGTVSVGKSTLVKELGKLPEFKNYNIFTEKSKELINMGVPVNKESTYLGQNIFTSYRAQELLHENMITDRSIIDVMAFTNLSNHFSLSSFKKRQMLDAWLPMVSYYDYIFYVDPEGVELEDNKIRSTNVEYRDKIDKEILTILDREYIDYFTISGSTKDRIKQVLQVINF